MTLIDVFAIQNMNIISYRFARAAEGYAGLDGANNSDSKSLADRES